MFQFLVLRRPRANHTSGYTNYGRMRGHGFNNDGTGSDLYMVANGYVAEDLRAGANDHAIADRRMPFPLFFARTAQRHSLVDQNVIANLGGFADDNAIAVVNEKPAPDARTWVDLDSGKETAKLRNDPRQE